MPATKKALTDVVIRKMEDRSCRTFLGQFSEVQVTLSQGTVECKHPLLWLRGFGYEGANERSPRVQALEEGIGLCAAIRERLRREFGNDIVASGVPLHEGRGDECLWAVAIPLGPQAKQIMATLRKGSNTLFTYMIRYSNIATTPPPTHLAPWDKGPILVGSRF